MRVTLLVIVALATGLLFAACGSSGGQTESVGGATVTVPADVHGLYPELETILDQLPYQGWYTRCVVARVKKELSTKEVEALERTSESSGAGKAEQVISAAGPACEKSSKRPLVDPNASADELALYRAGLVEKIGKIAEAKGFKSPGIECVGQEVEGLPRDQVIALGNGTHRVREGILLSVLAHCVKAE